MLFNSIDFALFLPIVFVLYWFVLSAKIKQQNLLLLVASYVFYGWWDWRFLSLIVFSSIVDYLVGIQMNKRSSLGKRKILLLVSIFVNIGFLAFFKYFNFFVDSFVEAFTFFGHHLNQRHLNIILPVGISFYTFQTLSYSIDIYKRKLDPTSDIIGFFAFVSFFPQLVAGPIERASNLLPQFNKKRIFNQDQAIDGMRQILWGLFKKVVIADGCAVYVNDIYSNYGDYSGSTLFLAAVLFAFQIYGDFSGYSDIAIGTARLFGFRLMKNFDFPYFSRDIAEFWRKWHISLSSWFRDYVYFPLGGNRKGKMRTVVNVFVVFIVSGFWHGANWTFIIWGLINAIFYLPLMLVGVHKNNQNTVAPGQFIPKIKELFNIIVTFVITVFAWVVFRSNTIADAFKYISGIFTKSIVSKPENLNRSMIYLFLFIVSFIVIEWIQRDKEHGLQLNETKVNKSFRWGIYYALILIIIVFGGSREEFIYFQF